MELHLHDRGRCKLAKSQLYFVHLIFKQDGIVSFGPKVSDNWVNTALRHFKTKHPQCVSFGYLLNTNSVNNKFYSIPPFVKYFIDITVIAKTKLDS